MPNRITRRRMLGAGAGLAGAAALGPLAGAARAGEGFPDTIRLPDGWRPEGITIGAQPFAYFGSLADGSIYRASLATGEGEVVSRGTGAPSVGLKTDDLGRLFVCGGGSGQLRVVDARGGGILRTYQAGAGDTFVNDVILHRGTAWFTDSRQARLYSLRLGGRGELPDTFGTLALGGDWVQAPAGTNASNGITRTPDGSALLVVNGFARSLFRVDPATGDARVVDLGGVPLANGDGLLLLGRRLYVVQNRQNAIDVFDLDRDGTAGTFVRRTTDARFDVPTTAAAYGDRIYLPNARFTTTPTPGTTYTAVAVPIG
ncbi:superoxide dismutase [Streptomyces sp. NPDC051940]|uniref:SMP-30/gluconolactonase/LRE family protein n=1 Tax=Streptomyces sp. NPDC051940 TaxID=3155675 RepID=UPI00344320A0